VTPADFRAALDRLGLSQSEAARRCGVNARTVRRWVAGDRPIPGPVIALIRTWMAQRPAA
jgi:DNA-binding transcriptional regulator YiaG